MNQEEHLVHVEDMLDDIIQSPRTRRPIVPWIALALAGVSLCVSLFSIACLSGWLLTFLATLLVTR
jgi:fatty acid desaturase